MINNFEDYTHELSDYELKTLVPIIVKGLLTKVGKENAITNNQIVPKLKGKGYKVSSSRIRKIVHYIRVAGLIPCLIATSKGYYISNDKEEIKEYIDSLHQRADSITFVAYALQGNLDNLNRLGGRPQ
jgi:hypothetical protein